MDVKKIINDYCYYALIAIISLLCMIVLPLATFDVDGGFNFPTTLNGWIVYLVNKLSGALQNVLIFHCFILQGRLNVKDNTNYNKALELLSQVKKSAKETLPRSEQEWKRQTYAKKGITIFITSVLTAYSFTQALIEYDLMIFLTYLFTLCIGLVFGFLQLKATERYYTDEFLQYALLRAKKETENGNQTS